MFAEEDEKLYGHLFASSSPSGSPSSSPPSSPRHVSLTDSDESEGDASADSDEDDGFGDLIAQARRERDEEEAREREKKEQKKRKKTKGKEEEGGRAGAESSDDEARYGSADEGAEEGDEDAVDATTAPDDDDDVDDAALGRSARSARSAGRSAVQSEAHAEGAHAAGSGSAPSLSELLSSMDDAEAARLGASRRDLTRLEAKSRPVSAPLPGPIKARVERRAGYAIAKEDAGKWVPQVTETRRARTVSFQSEERRGRGDVGLARSTAALASRHAAETPAELEIAALLRAAGAGADAAARASERELASRSVGPEEASRRADEMARARALLQRDEAKARRLKKIKSKDHRRRLRKAAARGSEAAKAALESGADDPEALALALEKAEEERALERLTLRHKNVGKWAKRAIRRQANHVDADVRAAVADQLEAGREIRRKAQGLRERADAQDDADGEDDSSDSDWSDDDDDDEERGKNDDGDGESNGRKGGASSKASRSAASLLAELDAEDAAEPEGLLALPFMRRAAEKRRAQLREEARALAGGDDGAATGRGGEGSAPAAAVGGLLRFQGRGEGGLGQEPVERKGARNAKATQAKTHDEKADTNNDDVSSSSESEGNGQEEPEARAARKRALRTEAQRRAASAASAGDTSSAGALAADFEPAATFRGAKEGYVFTRGPRGQGYYREKRTKGAVATVAGQNGAPKAAQNGAHGANGRKAAQKNGKKASRSALDDAAAGSAPPAAPPTSAPLPPSSSRSALPQDLSLLSQEELVRRAFAADDVAASFAAAKAAEAAEEAPPEAGEVEGAPMPGWGSWGAPKKEPEWVVRARERAKAKRAEAISRRQDAKLEHVIIREKWDRAGQTFKATSVPYPYDSREAYERSLRQPLGPATNVDASFRDMTRPEVLKDAGVVIKPMRFSQAAADAARAAPAGEDIAPVLHYSSGKRKRGKGDGKPKATKKKA